VQVQVPESQMSSIDDNGPDSGDANMSRPVLDDVATIAQVPRMVKMITWELCQFCQSQQTCKTKTWVLLRKM